MKSSLFFKKYSVLIAFISLVLVQLLLAYYHNTQNPHLCESNLVKPYIVVEVENNIFYKIRQYGVDNWKVLFKNINTEYTVTSSNNGSTGTIEPTTFRFKDMSYPHGNPQSIPSIDHTREASNIKQAVIDHFNSIQRGEFHPDRTNSINPNAHGKGSARSYNISSPLEQFELKNILGLNLVSLNISITNIGLYLTIAALLGLTSNLLATNYNIIIANNWSISKESIYATIHGIVINQINAIKGQVYFPFIYAIFIFILVNNLLGMVPYSFGPTSHFILTFFISFTVVLGSTILGFNEHRLRFFSLLVPSGCPLGLLPLLVLIELISYLARNVSLGLRLAANVLSGHMLLNILSGFVYKIINSGSSYSLLGLIPLAFIIAFSALELGIAFIQSQVFVVLSSSYVKDGIDLH